VESDPAPVTPVETPTYTPPSTPVTPAPPEPVEPPVEFEDSG
jgi:hypothetical protein